MNDDINSILNNIEHPRSRVLIVFDKDPIARNFFDFLCGFMEDFIEKASYSEQTIKFLNGARLYVRTSSHPERHLGALYSKVIFSKDGLFKVYDIDLIRSRELPHLLGVE